MAISYSAGKIIEDISMYTELTTRKIIREMNTSIWTSEEPGYIIVPQTPEEVEKVLDFLSPYFDDVDENDACLYDGCDCDCDDCNGMQMPELPKHDPNIA